MKIQIGQLLRVRSNQGSIGPESADQLVDWHTLTRGRWKTGASRFPGIFANKAVPERGAPGSSRRSSVVLLSNPFKAESEDTPWLDVIDSDAGYALYHGDNRKPNQSALGAKGNRLLFELFPLYKDPALRVYAPPILLFRQRELGGRKKGAREFCGYGIPVRLSLVIQKEGRKEGRFTNLVAELALFGLESENERFDWDWIEFRRDPSLTSRETLRFAPRAWRRWVGEGEVALESCRRRVLKSRISSPTAQLEMGQAEAELLGVVYEHYRRDKHAFEALASLVTSQVLGEGCERGWVTKRSGDGGVDFVSRLTLGAGSSSTSVVVLGQAKCVGIHQSIGGKEFARVVARLQRGWIGAFVTTGIYPRNAQLELHQDQYPLILINGKRLAEALRLVTNNEGIGIEQLLAREDRWYAANMQHLDPGRILDLGTAHLGHPADGEPDSRPTMLESPTTSRPEKASE
jgi:hypothetical protein